jgi:DNA gyrase subunit A
MDMGMIRKVDIDKEMQQSYLDYAMSVIVSRALPDARDGLKPVQRRILYSMYDMGLRADTGFKKSARIVGEVLGKYHPHGDMAVYESMARLAQDFTMRATLVDGQGNFGSVDGDPPAAMRYTEARLSPLAIELLAQLDRDTVDFSRNFDDTLDEPTVLPAAAPNLLVNGASGIAVGMATNIPPHNLGEVVDALIHMLHSWDSLDNVHIETLMKYIKGPDFPTGGIIILEGEENQLQAAYATGKGRVVLRGSVHKEEMTRGRFRVIITELPYTVNKSTLIERIAELVREGRLEGIADLRDESDRHGMRVVIELKLGADFEKILRDLYKHTPMQITIGINLLALVNGEPRLLALKQALRVFLEHRLQVVRRRSEFDLKQAQARLHILEGLRIALKYLDEIIALIRGSADTEQARLKLMKKYKLSEIQANAILDMPLKRLAALERKKIEDEFKALTAKIKELEGLLRSARKLRDVVAEELLEVKNQFNDRRRTQIVSLKKGEANHQRLTLADLTEAAETWVQITGDGFISRKNISTTPKYSGKLAPSLVLKADTHQTLYLVSRDGMAAAFAIHTLPEVDQPGEGTLLEKATPFSDFGNLTSGFVVPRDEAGLPPQYLITVTRQGLVKKSFVSDLPGPTSQMFPLVKINPGDELQSTFFTSGDDDLIIITRDAAAIRFSENEVRPMGLVAAGVNGIKLDEGDNVAGSGVIRPGSQVIVLDSTGKGWRLPAEEYPRQGRYGRGVSAAKVAEEAKIIEGFSDHRNRLVLVMLKKTALQSFRMDEIEQGKRTRIGQEIIRVKPGDSVERIVSLPSDRNLAGSTGARPQKKAKKPTKSRTGRSRTNPATEKPKKSQSGKKVVDSTKPKRKPTASNN